MNICASAKALSGLNLDCESVLIRRIWKAESRAAVEAAYPEAADIDRGFYNPLNLRELKRAAINLVSGHYGVEYLGPDRRTGLAVYYCNAGDSYTPTICFIGRRLVVADMAYWVESGRVKV